MRPLIRFSLTVTVLVVCNSQLMAQEALDEVRATHRAALKRLAEVLPKDHFAHRRLDDDIAGRWHDLFIDALDHRHRYFTAADIRRFKEIRDDLASHARQGDLSFANLVRDTYAKRVRQSTSIGLEWLGKQHDFTVNERIELRPESFADGEDALRERWRKWVKYELLVERAAGLSPDEAVDKIRARYLRIARENRYQNDEVLYELYLDTFVRSFDPHNQYFWEHSLAQFRL